MTMLAEYGTMSLAQVLEPAIEMADGFPIDSPLVNTIEHYKELIKQWPDSRRVMLPHLGAAHEAPEPGEIFRQPDLAASLRKLVEAERQALRSGKDRKAAIHAAYDRFYKGDNPPGDPYPFQGAKTPFLRYLEAWHSKMPAEPPIVLAELDRTFRLGTTSVEAADDKGWAVSVTPSGGWTPAVIAGHTGIGLSQRMQSFVLDPSEDPYNVLQPGKRPRATLTPSLALKDGKPYLVFSVQGGDTQDQNLLQFFLNVVEFGMTVQEATEAANITSYQMRDSFADHQSFPGRLTLNTQTPPWVREELSRMGYTLEFEERTSGPINAIFVDRKHGTLWGGSSNYGQDYGIGW